MVKFKTLRSDDPQIRELQEIMQYIEDNPFLKEQIPEYYPALEQAFKDIPPYVIANYIEKLPTQFNEEKNSIANMLPAIKTKEIESWLSIINFFLSENLMFNTYIKRAVKNVKAELSEMKDYCLSLSVEKEIRTFLWEAIPEIQLPNLYKRMNGIFIANADYEAFRAIFSGELIDISIIQLKWLKSNALLAYFVESLKNKIPFKTRSNIMQVAENCFIGVKNLSQSKTNYQSYNNNVKPKDYQLVDDLLKDL